MFKNIDEKWRKISKKLDNEQLYLDTGHKIIKKTNNFTMIAWLGGAYFFPKQDYFSLAELPQSDELPKISVYVAGRNSPSLRIFGGGSSYGSENISYGVEHRNIKKVKKMSDEELEDYLLKEAI